MGFSERVVGLVMKCVCSASYTIITAAHEVGPIFPSRGLRQGDPL